LKPGMVRVMVVFSVKGQDALPHRAIRLSHLNTFGFAGPGVRREGGEGEHRRARSLATAERDSTLVCWGSEQNGVSARARAAQSTQHRHRGVLFVSMQGQPGMPKRRRRAVE
jgi:hypothetical protein